MRIVLFACLLLVGAVSAAQSFGPDTTRTGVFTGQGVTPAGLECTGSRQGRTCSGFLPSAVDGTLLDVTVTVPHGAGPHALVALLHGWGGSKTSSGDIADALLGEGYAVLRYSARGFGRSWGQVNLADVNVEIADLRSMIGQLVDWRGLRIDGDAVAVTGASYGGGQSWLALLAPSFTSPAGTPVRIRTIVPIVPWSDLLYSLLPNGRPENSIEPPGSAKLSYVNGLFASGLRDSPERPYPNYPDYLFAWHAWINGMEPNRVDPLYQQIVDGIAGYRSIWWQRPTARVPVFQVQGWTDDLFPVPEAKRMLSALKAADPTYPIASYFGDIGHPRASNKPDEMAYVLGLIREWLAFYLRGAGTEPAHVVRAAITRPRDQAFSVSDVITAGSYAELATRTLAHNFAGTSVLINPVTDPLSGFFWDPLVMEAARELKPYPVPPPDAAIVNTSIAVFRVGVSELSGGAPLLIAGEPVIVLRASTDAPRVQLNVRLVEVAPDGTRRIVTRGTYIVEGSGQVRIPSYGNVWEARPGSALELEITNLDSPYITPSRVPSVTQVSDVRLELPVR
jgi:hypothetical protein